MNNVDEDIFQIYIEYMYEKAKILSGYVWMLFNYSEFKLLIYIKSIVLKIIMNILLFY